MWDFRVGAGVIDEDYCGNVGVVLFNHAKAGFNVTKGDRIAQLICQRIFYLEIEEETEEFKQTEREKDLVPRALIEKVKNFKFYYFTRTILLLFDLIPSALVSN